MWAGTGPRAIGINPEGWGRDLQILVWRGRDVAMKYDYILISYNVKKYEMKTLSKVVTSQTYIQIRVYQIKLSGDDTVNRVLLTSCCCTQRTRDFPVFKPGPTTPQIDASATSEGVWVAVVLRLWAVGTAFCVPCTQLLLWSPNRHQRQPRLVLLSRLRPNRMAQRQQ